MSKNKDIFGLGFTVKKYRIERDKNGNEKRVEEERWDSEGNHRKSPEAIPSTEQMPENEVKAPEQKKKEEE